MSTRRWLHAGVSTFVALSSIAACRQQPVAETQTPGGRLYDLNCSTCHGPNGKGIGDVPKIVGTTSILEGDYDRTVVAQGRNKMPSFGTKLTADQINAIVDYVATFRP